MAARHRETEESHEGYFTSVSDLMVGILFIFLLMLTVFALNFADEDKDAEIRRLTAERDQARTELADAQNHIRHQDDKIRRLNDELDALAVREAKRKVEVANLATRVSEIEAEVSTESRRVQELRSQLLARMKADLAAKQVNVEISEQQDVLRLPSTEVFQFGTSSFTPTGHDQMSLLLEEMTRLLPCYAAGPATNCDKPAPIFETILIEGHTDTKQGQGFDNWRLSTERALAVRSLMTGPFNSLNELRNPAGQPLLGLAGYGGSRTLPEIPGEDARNRRIEVRFLLTGSREAELAALRASLGQLRQRLQALAAP
jgi:flagellar motor protein MotB